MGSFTKLTEHIVLSTKYRTPSIRDECHERLCEYIEFPRRHEIPLGDRSLFEVEHHGSLLSPLRGELDWECQQNPWAKAPMATCWHRFAAVFTGIVISRGWKLASSNLFLSFFAPQKYRFSIAFAE